MTFSLCLCPDLHSPTSSGADLRCISHVNDLKVRQNAAFRLWTLLDTHLIKFHIWKWHKSHILGGKMSELGRSERCEKVRYRPHFGEKNKIIIKNQI